MRIAILADPIDNQNAGIHVFTKEMVDAMIRTNSGHEIILIREKRDPKLKGAEQIAVWNTRLPIGFASLRLFFIVPFILRIKKVDVVIEPAHFGPFNLPKRIKRITIIHDLTPILFPHLHRWHSQLLQKLFLKRILDKANVIITNSNNTSADVCNAFRDICHKVKRIYPGKSIIFKPDNSDGVLEKYHIQKPYFLSVGTIEPRKNLLILLKAFSLFKEQTNSTTELVIAGGKGWKSESFFNALMHHPYRKHIRLTGFVKTHELPTLYSNCQAFIYPSIYEGFGLPIIEAMSCGAPVIAANNSSLPEAGGGAALYFDASIAGDLSAQMTTLTSDINLRDILKQRSLDHATGFEWVNFAGEIWETIG